MRRLLIFIIVVLLLIAGWLFSAANGGEVTVNYLLNSQTGRLSYWLLGVFLVGFVVGVLYCGAALVRARLVNRRLRDRLQAQEQELQRLTAAAAKSTPPQ